MMSNYFHAVIFIGFVPQGLDYDYVRYDLYAASGYTGLDPDGFRWAG